MSHSDEPLQVGARYFKEAFQDQAELIRKARIALEGVDYDTMIGTGLSGSLVIPVLAGALDKHFAIVRKEPSQHDSSRIVGKIGHRWIFVDDFVSSGETRNKVKGAVSVETGKTQSMW